MMRSRAVAGDRRFYGVVEAVVTDNQDPEGQGRVRVVFPWFDEGETKTDWIRVAQPHAGPGYGFVWTPEIESEVLVGFVHGDMHLPIVVGGLYNGSDRPPTSPRAPVDQKLIKTRHGHELLFDEGETKRVRLTTAGGQVVDLDETAGTVTIDTGAGQTIVLDGSSVTITGASISLGQAATDPLVLGNKLLALFNTHVHTSAVSGTPTSTPLPLMTPAQLSQVTKTR